MHSDLTTLLILIIIFFSSVVRSTFGFGDALISMPLIGMLVGFKVATPLVGLCALVVAGIILFFGWDKKYIKIIWRLIIGSVVGIPLGIFGLKYLNENIIKTILAVVLLLFSIYNLLKPSLRKIKNQRWAYFFGFCAGMLGGAYNTHGPPVVMYGALRRWTPEMYRQGIQMYLLPTEIFIVISHYASGFWTKYVLLEFLLCIPLIVLAVFVGKIVSTRIPAAKFSKVIYILLIIISVVMFTDIII